MSNAVVIHHGRFGRAALYLLDRPMAVHAHREGHLIFHIEGCPARTTVEGRSCELSPGCAAAISPWQPHNFEPEPGATASLFLVLYLEPAWFLELSRDVRFAMRFGRTPTEMTPQLARLLNRVVMLLLEDEAADLLEGYLFELSRESFDRSWQWIPPGEAGLRISCVRDFRVRNSMRLMRRHLTDGVCLDEIARESGLSRPHFYKLFRQHLGITPNLYLNTLRVDWALDRLLKSNDSVTDIGLELGFSTQASFTRFFVSNVGIPPTDYRRVARVAA